MKTLTTISILLLLVYSSIVIHNAHSLSLHDRKSPNQMATKPYLNDDVSSSVDEYGSLEDSYPAKISSFLNKRRADSAEKYFDWASKTNRPMEYLRGKRFWLFTKKDEHAHNYEPIPSVGTASGTLSQGIWRSGIVGRRRR